MRSLVDAYSIANTVRMSRTVRKGASALLVEGSKDVRVFANLIDDANCDIVATDGKSNAVAALNQLRRSGHTGVLVVLDSDFSKLDGQGIIDPDVISTDLHDFEAMMLKSPAPEKVLREYDLRVDQFGRNFGQLLAVAVKPLGYLRLASQRSKLHLSFKSLSFRTFVRNSPVGLDERKLVREVLANNPQCRASEKDLREAMLAVADPSHDCWHVSCGHDMTALFAELLTARLGRDVPSFTVERQLRLAYHATDFASTAVCDTIRAWEQRNYPYRVLRRS